MFPTSAPKTDAIQITGVKDLKLRNVSVMWDEARPGRKNGAAPCG